MILRTSGYVRVELRQRGPGVSGGVELYRYQGESAPAGTDGWGKGLWLSWEEYDELVERVAKWQKDGRG